MTTHSVDPTDKSTTRQRSTREVRLFRRTLLKVIVFVTVCSVGAVVIVGTLQGQTGGSGDTYDAVFADVSGLVEGDPVRVSGVTVGKVKDVRIEDATHILVSFSANRDQQITKATYAQVRYANLLGQRFLALTRSGKPAARLEPGDTIPMTRTAPAVSLTTLLNGFRPLFQSLDPKQVNQLMGDLVDVLQGQSSRIDNIIAQTAGLTTNLADRSGLIVEVVDSLSTLVSTIARHDQQFAKAVTDLRGLTAYLARDSKNIARTIDSVGEMAVAVDGLVSGVRGANLSGLIRSLNDVGSTLVSNSDRLHDTFEAFPKTFTALNRITQSGSWANGYPCRADALVPGQPKLSVQDAADAVAIFLGLGAGNVLTTLLTALNLGDVGGSIPLDVPQGPVGPKGNSAVCR